MTHRVFTEEPGKDFDAYVWYDPLPGDVLHHEQKPNELQRYVPRWGGYWDHLKAERIEAEKKTQEGKDAA